MKLRKTIKKIMALGVGATMVGATILGASAVDLGDYPSPFVSDGAFSGALVIGDRAAAEDVIGVSAIASSLQYAASGGSSTSATTTVVGEAYTVQTGSNVLNFNEALTTIKTSIDSGELPQLLADGTVRNKEGKESDYKQKIKLPGGLTLTHIYDSHYNDKVPAVGISINKNSPVLNYTLDFSPDLESDVDTAGFWDDLEDRKITILGTEYDITKVENVSGSANVDITLMKGAIKDTLTEGETKTYTINDVPYEVTITLITDMTTGNKVKIVINGETTDALQEDETYKLSDGSSIGIREILPNEAGDVTQDMVTFYLGATKLLLDDLTNIEMDDEDVDNVKAFISTSGTSDPYKVTKIVIEWIADEDLFITEESTITLPGLGAISLGMSKLHMGVEEEILVRPNGEDRVELVVPLEDCVATFDLLYDGNDDGHNWTVLGSDADEQLVTNCITNCIINETDQYAIISEEDEEETHIIEVTKVSDDDGITVKDICGNTIVSDFDLTANNCVGAGSSDTFDVGDITVTLNCYNESFGTYVDVINITVSSGNAENFIYSAEGMKIGPMPASAANQANLDLMFDVEDKNENIGDGRTFNLTMASNSGSDNEASITLDGTSDGNIIVNDKRETGRNTDIYEAYFNDTVSAKILEDQTDSDAKAITILYAGEETYGEIYIAAEGTVVTPGASASTTTVAGKIDVSATKLASEISDVTAQNLVLVGGPCANTAAAEVMGNPADCVAGFEAGKGLIQLFDDTGAGNVAILVAGMNAEDTRAAAMVLAEYDKYATDLDGKTKVEVSTATSTVTEVVDMPEEETMEDTTTV
jgi:acyl carrier protein